MTLVELGFVEQYPRRRYRLAPGAAGPGCDAISAIRRRMAARVALEELRDEIGYTVSMGVLDGARVVYVHRLFGHRPGQHAIDLGLGVGGSVPVYCTALGKALLASLCDVQRCELLASLDLIPYGPRSILVKSKLSTELDGIDVGGAVLSDEELVAGSRSIAMLVRRPASGCPLAIEVTVPSAAFTLEGLCKEIGPRLERAVRLI